ncbi:patatin [Frankia sp. CcI156]|uniref:Patatin n=1 Tax=Frankia casuarinae (strain DSM 45818 / CECT 9043 / HFP020203 / CcI3) TaxID=106370 RepID=Q2JEY3_FRACC|nr:MULTISPECIES: patatin-like phospholipase family protein [Frankia]ABD10159.1 Patatin [Frankia casuarinae]ETA04184.1 putative esterase of the alpha-beta hydrolase superfamily [Frankia sp. CcI6]EYT93971.1 putative esterase of the alpha-beta hydrolase superfamily [Frankia casuarinae]KFB05600.1 putative esterase of the alpha-beta hydrolase superfamily [Frankia sp. Allo2]OAA27628.1 NTE family protein [Frankia casuarinae]
MTRKRAPRRGLVLGAGGVLGSAWMIGAMRAVETATGRDLSGADLVVGTSAGSVVAALLGLGIGIDVMANSERGIYEAGDPVLDYRDLGASLPPRPRMRMGSPRLLTASARHPRRSSPMVTLAAMLPQGRGKISAVGDLVTAAMDRKGLDPTEWPTRPALRVVAMNFDTGERVLFGVADAPRATLSEAVMASCAIPGWYAPVTVDGQRFVDGGTRSPASVDLLADAGLAEILVLAPACSFQLDRPRGTVARVERQVRRAATRRLMREVEMVEAAGTRVTVLCPGPEDLEVIGGNVMDLTRRAQVFETALRTTGEALHVAARSARSGVAGATDDGATDDAEARGGRLGLGLAG